MWANSMIKILHILSIVIGSIGVAVIVWGVILTVSRLLKLEIKRLRQVSVYRERESLRHQFGSYLLLALEFMIAADIIATFTHPTLKDIAFLGGIVAIRTVISYFLEKEIEKFNPTEAEKEMK